MEARQYLWLLTLWLAVQAAYAWPTVRKGAKGPEVVAMQDLLKAHGHSLTADGDFGPLTEGEVKSFQRANGLTVDGIVGPQTWPKLIVTVRYGSSGYAVHGVQYLLAHKHSLLGASDIDSEFGPKTKSAAISFQARSGLEQDGIVGPLTWNALVSNSGSTGGTPAAGQPCSSVTRSRDGVVAAAKDTVGKSITYTQSSSRWSGIANKACPPSVPTYADCSSFVTWLFWTAYGDGPDFVNDLGWGAGWTGSMKNMGTLVSLDTARPGDVVIYFNSAGKSAHAAFYIGNSQIVNFGGTGKVSQLSINFFKTSGTYPSYSIRSFSQVV